MKKYSVLVLIGVFVGGMALLAGYGPAMGAPRKRDHYRQPGGYQRPYLGVGQCRYPRGGACGRENKWSGGHQRRQDQDDNAHTKGDVPGGSTGL